MYCFTDTSGFDSSSKSDFSFLLYQVALSILWVFLSALVVFFGFWHCRARGYHYTIQCDKEDCQWSSFGVTTTQMMFKRSDLVDAEFIRIDKDGEFTDSAKMKRDKRGRYGYSIRMKVRQPLEEGSRIKTEKWIVYNPNDMGRRLAKSGTTSIKNYIENKDEKLYLNNGKTVTVVGVLSIFFGAVSMLLACVLGEFQDHNPRRMKKAS